jgi:hypothetical protein
MATYLQGVTDYIPQFQPFEPDLNFYNNALQTKQTQYDNNYKALNNIYGQYFYSNLTKESNQQRKDKILKDIDFELKRVSGLDLSLEQNVDQATQIFRPFYENKFVMKDMAWTKNYNNEKGKALSYKNSRSKEDIEKYWPTGVKALDYMKEEFKNTTDDESLTFGNAEYTPYVNAFTKYHDYADKLKIQRTIDTPQGGYMVTTKNGEAVIPTLLEYFQSYAVNDPSIQAVYSTKAYVNRMDQIYTNKDTKFKGDYKAAERAYLAEQYRTITAYADAMDAKAKDDSTVTRNKKEVVEKSIKDNAAVIAAQNYLNKLNEAEQVYGTIEKSASNLKGELSEGSRTAVTSSIDNEGDIFKDVESLRRKVDAGTAAMFMQTDIYEAAKEYAYTDYSVSRKADEFALESVRARNRAAEQKRQRDYDKENILFKHNLDTGYYIMDVEGNVKVNPYFGKPLLLKTDDTGAQVETNVPTENQKTFTELAGSYLNPHMKVALSFIEGQAKAKLLTEKEKETFGLIESQYEGKGVPKSIYDIPSRKAYFDLLYHSDKMSDEQATKNMSKIKQRNVARFMHEYRKNPEKAVQSSDTQLLRDVKAHVDAYAIANSGLPAATAYLNSPTHGAMDYFSTVVDGYNTLKTKNKQIIVNEIKGSLDKETAKYAEMFFNEGNVLSKEAFIKLASRGQGTSGQKGTANPKDFKGKYVGGTPLDILMPGVQNLVKGLVGDSWDDQAYANFTPAQRNQVNTLVAQERAKYLKKGRSLPANQEAFVTKQAIAKIAGVDPETGSSDFTSKLGSIYDNLSSKFGRVATSTKLHSIHDMSNFNRGEGSKYGIASNTYQGYGVQMNIMNEGFNAYVETMRDLQNSNWRVDPVNFKVSFDGNNVSGYSKGGLGGSKQRAQMADNFLNSLSSRIGDKDVKFEIFNSQLANENRNMGAMVIKPSLETLEPYIIKEDAKGNMTKNGIFTKDQAKRIAQKGITIAAPRETWNNSLFKQNEVDPIEGLLNAGIPVEYKHPSGHGKFKMEASQVGLYPYTVVFDNSIYDPQTGEYYGESQAVPMTEFGNNAKEAYNTLVLMLNQAATISEENHRNYRK